MFFTVFLALPFIESCVNAQKNGLIYYAVEPGQFVHDSIPTATKALIAHGMASGIQFDSSEDSSLFTDAALARYDALVFLMNTGEVLDPNGKSVLQRFLDRGGGFIALHSASDALRNTTFYGNEVGAWFDYHPALQNATIDVIDTSHPSTNMLPTQWHVQDELYNFKSDPRSLGAKVVLSANESSYTDPGPRKYNQGTPHPIAWYQEHGAGASANGTAGRSFYTSLGHLNESWEDDLFMGHVMGGVQWVLQLPSGTMNSTDSGGTSTSTPPRSSESDSAPSIPNGALPRIPLLFGFATVVVLFLL